MAEPKRPKLVKPGTPSVRRTPLRLGALTQSPKGALPMQHRYKSGRTVFDATLDRMRWIFEEFEGRLIVSCSGGKDSTVVVEMAARVAKEMGFLPLKVYFLDQEAEFQATIDYQRYLAYERDDIDFHWFQVPFEITNSADHDNGFLHAWGPGMEWMRPKEPTSYQENVWPGAGFYDLMSGIHSTYFPDYCQFDGMRAEESPERRMMMLGFPNYKWITWATTSKIKDRCRFHAIYDWRHFDIWKAIHDNGWRYNTHYDEMWRWGHVGSKMRVSSFIHEHSIGSLRYLQEVEPETWEAVCRRLAGINAHSHTMEDMVPKNLPYMFRSWEEYMGHLIENLIGNPEARRDLWGHWEKLQRQCSQTNPEVIAQAIAKAAINGDSYGIFLAGFLRQHADSRKKKIADEKRVLL